MREWGGRCSGGGPKPRIGNSGIPADEWATFGKETGEKMRAAKKDGFCVTKKQQRKCKYWGLNAGPLKQLEEKWGKVDDEFIKRNSHCCLTPEEWYKTCPAARVTGH